jgi:hypothetical protein
MIDPYPIHPIPPQCRGERCTICGGQAHHKVGEEFLDGQGDLEMPGAFPIASWMNMPIRHNLTAYLCCGHFRQVMGGTGTTWCVPSRYEAPPLVSQEG